MSKPTLPKGDFNHSRHEHSKVTTNVVEMRKGPTCSCRTRSSSRSCSVTSTRTSDVTTFAAWSSLDPQAIPAGSDRTAPCGTSTPTWSAWSSGCSAPRTSNVSTRRSTGWACTTRDWWTATADAKAPRIDPKGAVTRLGHSVAFFIGTAYGSTETAERLAATVRAMHHTIKGVRPDGAAYDADDPDWLRWNYATVVWGLATAHEMYHPRPLRGKKLDRYYGEFVRVGHALGGTDLPTTKAETLDCLESYLPRLALTHGAAMATGPNLRLAAKRDRLGHPRHHAEVGRPAGPASVPQHRRTHRAPDGRLDGHQRVAHRGRTHPSNSPRRRPGSRAGPRCRTPRPRTCRAPIRCAAAPRSSGSWPPVRCDPVHTSFASPRHLRDTARYVYD